MLDAACAMRQVVIWMEVLPLRQQLACAVSMIPGSMLSSGHKLKIRGTSDLDACAHSGATAKSQKQQKDVAEDRAVALCNLHEGRQDAKGPK